MKIEVLTEEEYEDIKWPGLRELREYIKKQTEEKLNRLRAKVEKLDSIIDLKYDKDGNPTFEGIFSGKYPKNVKYN